jgi:hypothetical protein
MFVPPPWARERPISKSNATIVWQCRKRARHVFMTEKRTVVARAL